MAELLTSAQMRAIEAAAIGSGAVSGLELMERAGRGVVAAVFEEWPALAPEGWAGWGASPPDPPRYLRTKEGAPRAVVLCGPGNNGGDGFVVARVLAGFGWAVEVFLFGDPAKLPPDARENYDRWVAIGAVEAAVERRIVERLEALGSGDLVVDALFGTGLTRPFLALAGVQRRLNGPARDWPVGARPRVVAVDLPSGFCSDSGRYLGEAEDIARAAAIHAELTVTFHRRKLGHALDHCAEASGRVIVCDIGLEPEPWSRLALVALYGPDGGGAVEPHVARLVGDLPDLAKQAGHKFSHGHVLVLAGGAGKGGAARLAARAALRVGAGLVTVAPPHLALAENAARLDAVMLEEIDDAAALGRVLEDVRLNALVLGPGLGHERARALVPAALAAGRATVLDADALSAFASEPETLFEALHQGCVLTPHMGEFARLFPDLAQNLAAPASAGPAYSKVDAARAAAARAGCTVLLKGPDTVVAAPSGEVRINAAFGDHAAPWLATAGSGDVLAGLIGGLLARGQVAFHAAAAATRLHVDAARAFGPGLIAEDLPEALPGVFRQMGL